MNETGNDTNDESIMENGSNSDDNETVTEDSSMNETGNDTNDESIMENGSNSDDNETGFGLEGSPPAWVMPAEGIFSRLRNRAAGSPSGSSQSDLDESVQKKLHAPVAEVARR